MQKKVLGYTTSVYDMFHIRHLDVIHRTKKKILVIPFGERIQIVMACSECAYDRRAI